MVEKIQILENPVAELYLLMDHNHRQGYFYVDYSGCSISFRDLNEAISEFDRVTLLYHEKILRILQDRAARKCDIVIGKST
jgi:RecB family endonuclease NucS